MNIVEAKEEIIHTVKVYTAKDEKGAYLVPQVNQRPILLMGPPGIGKTAIVRQVASMLGIGLVSYTITHHTRQSAVGLPVVVDKEYNGKMTKVTEYTMSEIVASVYECMKETHVTEGILFMDEINCVSETLAPTMLQFLQNKTFGTHSIPEGWVIVAAGNPPAYNKAARLFDVVTMDRVKNLSVEIDFDSWKAYALDRGIHSIVYSYLSAKPQHFYYIEEGRGEREFVTARGWEDLSILMKAYEKAGIEVTQDVVAAYLNCDRIVQDFFAYYSCLSGLEKEYQMAELLDGKLSSEELQVQVELLKHAKVDECYNIVQMLLSALLDSLHRYQAMVASEGRKKEVFKQIQDFAKRAVWQNAEDLMEQFLRQFGTALQIRKEHKILSQQALAIEENVEKYYQKCKYRLMEARVTDHAETFEILASYIEEDQQTIKETEEQIQEKMNRAFSFLEDAVGEGDGMLYFMTSLSMNQSAAAYLEEHAPRAYKKHLYLLEASMEEEALKKQISKVIGEFN